MVAHGCRDQTDLIRLSAPLGCLCENVFRRDYPGRIIVITGPAKTTALRATARDLHEQPISHLCLGRPHRCRWAKDLLIDKKLGKLRFAPLHRASKRAFLWGHTRERSADLP